MPVTPKPDPDPPQDVDNREIIMVQVSPARILICELRGNNGKASSSLGYTNNDPVDGKTKKYMIAQNFFDPITKPMPDGEATDLYRIMACPDYPFIPNKYRKWFLDEDKWVFV